MSGDSGQHSHDLEILVYLYRTDGHCVTFFHSGFFTVVGRTDYLRLSIENGIGRCGGCQNLKNRCFSDTFFIHLIRKSEYVHIERSLVPAGLLGGGGLRRRRCGGAAAGEKIMMVIDR